MTFCVCVTLGATQGVHREVTITDCQLGMQDALGYPWPLVPPTCLGSRMAFQPKILAQHGFHSSASDSQIYVATNWQSQQGTDVSTSESS